MARTFTNRVREQALAADVLESLTPAQQVLKIVDDALVEVLGGESVPLDLAGAVPAPIMLVGLQGSGKTTSAAKLALMLRREGQRPYLVAADIYRPAAIEQLLSLGRQVDIPVYEEGAKTDPVDIASHAITWGKEEGHTAAIIDTAGRLQINEELMQELTAMSKAVQPSDVLLVANAMTGQEAVNVAQQFHEQVTLTGLILTQMDGDARGGAALSIRSVTGIPIKFMGVGERIEPLEPFHPDRLASRILGMGDMVSLIERAQETFDEEEAAALEKKMRTATFNLEDFLDQMQKVRGMGSMSQIMEMIPGFSGVANQPGMDEALDESQFRRVESIIYSMTLQERQQPQIINGSRRRRIAWGSGTTVQEVNQLLNQFRQMQRMMRDLARGRMPRALRGLPGGIGDLLG
ncbi:MAG: signal recognition particle protein [Dehalococcoidia bacterium]|nr:signal recognition particle protein [Dehalococcoidia bacterium]